MGKIQEIKTELLPTGKSSNYEYRYEPKALGDKINEIVNKVNILSDSVDGLTLDLSKLVVRVEVLEK